MPADDTYSLDGTWQLFGYPRGAYDFQIPEDLLNSDIQPIPAKVPGNVELDLVQAGLLPEPFEAKNIQLLRSYETYEWWYQRQFSLPPDFPGRRTRLVFEGLDTYATIWLNGKIVGQSANMLIPQRFDVSEALDPEGENLLVVRLSPAMHQAATTSYDAGSISWEHRAEGLAIRKAPHMWGWDIMPRAVSAGIWRPVRLETIPECDIDEIYYWTVEASQEQARLGVWFHIRTESPEEILSGEWTMRFQGISLPLGAENHPGDPTEPEGFSLDWPIEFNVDSCQIDIPKPKLWYPTGYGEPHLYQVTARLCRGTQILAERSDRIGLRKVNLDRTEVAGQAWTPQLVEGEKIRLDSSPLPESHFVFYVNDTPIMVKGTNWVPLDAFHSRDQSRLAQALQMIEDLQCNMIRCWGGNVYESEAFFDWCDAHGVLVWQDFAFACCIYPQQEYFLDEVRREAEEVVRQLRNHPCLVVWCGDNEIDMVYLSNHRDPQQNRLTRQVIPQVIERCDPYRAYLPSSPFAPGSVVGRPNAWQATPEQHLWGPRGYFKDRFYTHHSAHFIGEIGYHGCPNISSIKKFISKDRLWSWQENDEWQVHSVYHWLHNAIQRDRIQLMVNQIRALFGEIPAIYALQNESPEDEILHTFALASQIAQAEAKKFFIESTRLRKWQTSGILWWNLLDGWPQFSDAIVDYYFGKKLAYHYIRRVQQPICVWLAGYQPSRFLCVVIGNDSQKPAEIIYHVRRARDDEILASGSLEVPANQNWQATTLPVRKDEQDLFLIEWQHESKSFGNHFLLGSPPFDFGQYLSLLPKIASLPEAFEAHAIAH